MILLNRLTDKKAKRLQYDFTDLKMSIARKYLNKIKNPAQWKLNKKRLRTQIFAEGFFHNSYSAIEIIMHQIEEELKIIPLNKYDIEIIGDRIWKNQDNYPQYRLQDFMKSLKNSNHKKAQKLYPIFEKYFSKPIKNTNDQWDFSKSKLWILREIRNSLAHSPSLSEHANITVGSTRSHSITFAFRLNMRKPNGNKNGLEVVIAENNPRQFFEDLFSNLEYFRKDIRKILPRKSTHASSIYKNPPDFGVKF